MAFQTPIANTDVYKGSFFIQTIRDWNALPDSLISSAEDAESESYGLISLITVLVRDCCLGVSPVNYPDPDPGVAKRNTQKIWYFSLIIIGN